MNIITATGARPAAFSLCEKWMAAQDYQKPVRWVIVDDGITPQPITFKREGWEIILVRPSPFWKPGDNTQARNLLKGLDACDEKDLIVFIEDDDHYHPSWLSRVARESGRAEVVGENRARYYNFKTKTARQLSNLSHSSLCSTAIRGSAIKTFRKVCTPGVKFIDMNLWRQASSKYLFPGTMVTGIKGLPGREGIGMGHRPDFSGTPDRDGAILSKWIGADAELYHEHIEP